MRPSPALLRGRPRFGISRKSRRRVVSSSVQARSRPPWRRSWIAVWPTSISPEPGPARGGNRFQRGASVILEAPPGSRCLEPHGRADRSRCGRGIGTGRSRPRPDLSGASLMALPAPRLTLADKHAVNASLLTSGASGGDPERQAIDRVRAIVERHRLSLPDRVWRPPTTNRFLARRLRRRSPLRPNDGEAASRRARRVPHERQPRNTLGSSSC